MKNSLKTVLAGACALVLISGCSGEAQLEVNTPDPAPAEPAPEPEADPEPAAEAPAEDPSDVHLEGDHLTIDTMVQFKSDSDEILPESNDILDHIAVALKNHTDLTTLHVVGHTDASGGHDHNQDLSERRAAAVVKALRDRGVKQTIDSRGVGETEPECKDDTKECHSKNRRVEFIVEKG